MSRRREEIFDELLADRSLLQLEDDGAVTLIGECAYCGCTEDYACELTAEGERVPVSETGVIACGWHVAPRSDGFACCSAAECVRVYLNDPSAP